MFAKKKKDENASFGGVGDLAKFVSWKNIGARLAQNAQHFHQASILGSYT